MLNKRIYLYLILLLSVFELSGRIIVYGDTRSQPEIHKKIISQIIKFPAKAAFHTGDLNSYGLRQSEYDAFFESMKPITDHSKLYPVKGNHERNGELYLANFPKLRGQTYYSVTEDSMVFIILDTNMKIGPGSTQYKWLQATLEQNKQNPMIVLMHHPIFSSGTHGDELGLSFFLPALFANYPVMATFCGHDHTYERSEYKNQFYIVTGGGGAPLYSKDSRNDYSKKFLKVYNFCVLEYTNAVLKVNVYDIDGIQIDEFSAKFKIQTKSTETEKE